MHYLGPSRFKDAMYLMFIGQLFLLLVALMASFDGILLNYYIALPFAIYFSITLILAEEGENIYLWKIPIRMRWALSIAFFDFLVYLSMPSEEVWHSLGFYFTVKGIYYLIYFAMQALKMKQVQERLSEKKRYFILSGLSLLFSIPLLRIILNFSSVSAFFTYWPISVVIFLFLLSKIAIPILYYNRLLAMKRLTRCLDIIDQVLFLIVAFFPMMLSLIFLIARFF